MTLLEPGALVALAAVPLILLMYILRPHHRRQVVPSVRLWQHLSSDLEGRPRWRLPLASLLLLLQLLVAGGVAFALARPALPGATRQHLILVIDTSPTMLSTDVSPNRLALATRDARELLSQLKPEDLATLIAMDPLPRIAASGQGPTALDGALGKLTAAPRQGDVRSALLLAAQTAAQSSDTHNRIVVLSDGTFDNTALAGLGPIPADVSFQQVGGSDDNQAITALSVRPMIGSIDRYLGFVQITNFSHQDKSVGFQATADGIPVDQRTLKLPARGHVEVSLPLPVGTRSLAVSLRTDDKYALDNQAQVLVPASTVVPVTVVATDPTIWERALKTLPNVQVRSVAPGAYRPDNAAVTIFDGFVPASLPTGAIILVAPPQGNSLIQVSGTLPTTNVIQTDPGNPLFDSVDLTGLAVPQADRIEGLSWAQPIVETGAGPVMFQGELQGRNVVVIGFEPSQTQWPERIAFPIFVANVVQTLAPATFPTAIAPGDVLDIPATGSADRMLVQLPNGKVDVFAMAGRPIRFADTAASGQYTVTALKGTTIVSQQQFVASKLGVAESDIMPRVDPQQLTRVGSPPGQPSEHDVWPWVAGGALVVMSAEWFLYFRRLAP
ncbi:MAG TPA: BatA and WFA domain-containing protein [Chloroflexota bacterium]|nr:BatA and WFA domain-containing protein [Chloroflexota bacterium]